MTHCHRSGRVEIRPVERLLLIDGHKASIGARAFDLLLALLEHRDRVVSHNELLDLVWPHLVVELGNIQVQVSALRKVLGPQAIATIPGRGYQFTLRLDDEPGAPLAPTAPANLASSTGAARRAPPLSTLLFGRDQDLAALDGLLRDQRLLTLVGAPGIGKTSVALALAHRQHGAHPDGCAWVELAALADPSLLTSAVARAAGLPLSAGNDPLPGLVEGLRPLRLLLVLDNAEHLIAMAARLAQAVSAGAPQVRVLVTSQVPLRSEGEWVFRLDALSVPRDGVGPDEAMTHGAVALFAARAAAADRRFSVTRDNLAAVVDLCRRLDGIPLAIQLAAARLPLLGLQGVTARLADRLQLLRGSARDVPTRQQTLLAALESSHGLLDAAEQKVLRRLSVFAGGFTLELASAVASDEAIDKWAVIDALGALVDRSLVTLDGADVPRYRLPESVREHAGLKLDQAQERDRMQRRHAEALSTVMDLAYEDYWSTPDAPWLANWAPDIDNVRAALDWGVQQRAPVVVALMGGASLLFLLLGLAPEGRKRCDAVQALLELPSPGAHVSRYWLERGRLHWGISNPLMHDHALKAADLYRAAGDARGLFLALRCMVGSAALPVEQAWQALDEMARLERPQWPARLRAQRKLAEISALKASGHMAQAHAAAEALLALARAAGLDLVVSAVLSELASLSLSLGRAEQAIHFARLLLDGLNHRRDNFDVHAHACLAQASLALGRAQDARAAMLDFLASSRSRDWEWFGLYADLSALFAACEGRVRAAARLLGYADAVSHSIGERGVNMATARARAWAVVEAALKPREIGRLMAAGAQADIESVCSWTLADTDD